MKNTVIDLSACSESVGKCKIISSFILNKAIFFFTSCPKICIHGSFCAKLHLYCDYCETTGATFKLEQCRVCCNHPTITQKKTNVTENKPTQAAISALYSLCSKLQYFKDMSKACFCHPHVMLCHMKGEPSPFRSVN